MPPVTPERSPPASRITGALSPVIADSSTEATPLDDLAVGRDHLPGLDDHVVARRGAGSRRRPRRLVARGSSSAIRGRVLAGRAEAVGLRLAAGLGQRLGEVGEEDRERAAGRQRRPGRRSGRRRAPWRSTETVTIAVSTVPTSTRNITGLRSISRGSSMANDRHAAMRTSVGLEQAEASRVAGAGPSAPGLVRLAAALSGMTELGVVSRSSSSLDCSAAPLDGTRTVSGPVGRQVVGDRAEHDRRHERQGADQEHRAQSITPKVRLSVRSVPVVSGTRFFSASKPAIASGKHQRRGTGRAAGRSPWRCSRPGCYRRAPRTPSRCWPRPSENS